MSTEHSHHLSTSSSCISSTMSIEDIQILSTSSATSIATTMSIDDIQILSTSPALLSSTSSNTNGASSISSAYVSSLSSLNTNNLNSSSSNTNNLSSSSSNTNNLSSSSSSSNYLPYSSKRISYLLKHEKYKYRIVDNKASSAVAPHWSVFGFPAKLNEKTSSFERIIGFASCNKCKKTFVYGTNSGTTHLKQHSCVIDADMKVSTQTSIDKMMLVRKKLSDEQSKVIKDLIVWWVCGDIRPFSIIDDHGLRELIQECVRLGMHLFFI